MVTSLGKTNLVAEIDKVRSETKLSRSAESDEQEKIRVISRLEGGHRGGEKVRCLVGRCRNVKFMKRSHTCGTCQTTLTALTAKDNSESGCDDCGRVPTVHLFSNADDRPGRRRRRQCQPMANLPCPL